MCKIRTCFITIFILLAITVGYFFYSFEIYDKPRVTLSTIENQAYYPVVAKYDQMLCYQAQTIPSISFSNEINTLVWNIHKGGDKGWKSELEKLAQNMDLVLLQEVSSTQNIGKLLQPFLPTSLYARGYSYLNHESGVNTLSKISPIAYCAGAEAEPWIQVPKIGIVAEYLRGNQPSLLVINLHLVNFEWNLNNYKKQVTQLFKVINDHKGPIILAGDFNTWNHRRLALIRGFAERYNLKEVGYTNDMRKRFMGNPLDHVFVRDIKVMEAKVIKTESSDHNPLLLKLKL